MGRIVGDARPPNGDAAREKLILDLQPLVLATARFMRQKLSWVAIEDLQSVGQLGLITAIDSYDPEKSKGLSLRIWAMYKIRGAMLDSVKRRNYQWEKHDVIDSNGRALHRAKVLDGNFDDRLRDGDEYRRDLSTNGRTLANATDSPLASAPDNSDATILAAQRLKILRNMIQRLPPDERAAVRTFLNGKTLRQAGEQIHVRSRRCWDLRQAGLAKLRERLAKRGLGLRELLEK